MTVHVCMHACSTRIRLVVLVVCLLARVHAARAVLCAHAHDPMNGRIISLVIADLVCIRLAVIAGICQSWTARLPPPLQCLLLSVYNGRTARKLFSVFCICGALSWLLD